MSSHRRLPITTILTQSGKPYPNVPFDDVPVIAGAVHQDKLAVIVNDHAVWTFTSGRWHQAVSTDLRLNCVCWTLDDRLLA